VLDGFNGTIFAYGQTGSGKTFTITGGAERYADRGIIPRAISYIFGESKKKTDCNYRVSISYLEIYNEHGYDLLDENHATKELVDLPKVQLLENQNEQFIMKNLSVRRVENEEDALNYLFIGDTNRVVSETPKNDASTRSHCIFIINVEKQKYGEDVSTRGTLHLVDLSGSERIGKTGIEGLLLKEAKYINLSLHYLEQVIVCLHRRTKGENVYVPYRNSMMTMVLRDSIGGNCKTKMIATMSADPDDIDESLCTCGFAKRVSKISNDAQKNEILDPALVIQRLKNEVNELKAELALVKGTNARDHLTGDDIELCKKMVEDYIENKDPAATIPAPDKLAINQCFFYFKYLLLEARKKMGSQPALPPNANIAISNVPNKNANAEIEQLHALLKQRENEILILVKLLDARKQQAEGPHNVSPPKKETLLQCDPNEYIPIVKIEKDRPTEQQKPIQPQIEETKAMSHLEESSHSFTKEIREMDKVTASTKRTEATLDTSLSIAVSQEDLADRAKAFDIFRKSYRKNEAMEENKDLLKDKYKQGKELGMAINSKINRIKELTNKLEQIRKENALKGLIDSANNVIQTEEMSGIQDEIIKLKLEKHNETNQLKEDPEFVRERQNKDAKGL
jgi:kinesin family member 6/9